jgi:hypothetical protein
VKLIQTVTVGSGGVTEINFTNIPQSFTDLVCVFSLRSGVSSSDRLRISLNSGTGTFSVVTRRLQGDGAATVSQNESNTFLTAGFVNNTNQTANTFSSHTMYLPNYTSSSSKTLSFDCVTENNATAAFQTLSANSHNISVGVNAIRIFIDSFGNIAQNSSVSLYGILKGSDGIVTTS